MKKRLLLVALLALFGCGGGGTPSETSSFAAAKAIQGVWDLSYSTAGPSNQQRFQFFPIGAGLVTFTPSTTDFSFYASSNDYNGMATSWTANYALSTDTWTIANSSAELVFRTDGSALSSGACWYAIQSDGSRSSCVPVTGAKISNLPLN